MVMTIGHSYTFLQRILPAFQVLRIFSEIMMMAGGKKQEGQDDFLEKITIGDRGVCLFVCLIVFLTDDLRSMAGHRECNPGESIIFVCAFSTIDK